LPPIRGEEGEWDLRDRIHGGGTGRH